jgi:gluconolactonase
MRSWTRILMVALFAVVIARGASAEEKNFWLFFGDKLTKTEGIAMCPNGKLYVSENDSGKVWLIAGENDLKVYVEGLGHLAGLACGPDNALYIDEYLPGAVTRVVEDKKGKKTVTKIAEGLKAPNGVVVMKDNTVLVSETDGARVTMIAPGGATETLSDGITFANGMVLNDDESVVYVAATTPGRIYAVPLIGENKGKKTVFAKGVQMVDGITRDPAGNMYACLYATGQIVRIAPDGTKTTIATGLKSPASPWFFNDSLFVTSLNGTGVYKVSLP